jgi:hypothetical protein
MGYLLKLGPFQFIIAKWLLTTFGLVTLLILKNYYFWKDRVRAATILFILPFLYLVLVSYELYLLINL